MSQYKFIPYGRQDILDTDIAKVIEVLKSDFLTQGPIVPEFEKSITSKCEVNYATACNSATSALHLACNVLNIGKNSTVWTSPISFVASANCALYCGANIDFIDIDPETLNISIYELEKKLKSCKKLNKLPDVLICVHYAGSSCEMDEIYRLSREYNFKIIEDASHAIGGKYKNKKIGSCEYSDITVFSFHPVKIITSGEGGIATTNNIEYKKKMDLLRSHGITRDDSDFINMSHGNWYYEQQELGFNYRMTDIHAALGISQLSRLDDYVLRRINLAEKYDENLDFKFFRTQKRKIYESAHHLYVLICDSEQLRNNFFNFMISKNIGVNIHYIPIHLQPYYQRLGFKSGDYPNAEDYYSKAITIPLFSSMSYEIQEQIINLINNYN